MKFLQNHRTPFASQTRSILATPPKP